MPTDALGISVRPLEQLTQRSECSITRRFVVLWQKVGSDRDRRGLKRELHGEQILELKDAKEAKREVRWGRNFGPVLSLNLALSGTSPVANSSLRFPNGSSPTLAEKGSRRARSDAPCLQIYGDDGCERVRNSSRHALGETPVTVLNAMRKRFSLV